MKITSKQAEKIFKGNVAFSQFGFTMLVTRLKTLYAGNPSPSTVQIGTEEINKFLEKYKSIMDNDYKTMTAL